MFLVFLFSVSAHAVVDRDLIFYEALRTQGIQATPLIIEDPDSGIITKGYEFHPTGKIISLNSQAIVMQHGWHSNPSEFIHYIGSALNSGYRVFAFSWVGHGWGPENDILGVGNRSWIRGARPEDYNFDRKIQQAKIISDYMLANTKSFVSLGHSMGAMMTAAANSMGLWKAQRMIQIGGPAHFEFLSAYLKPLAELLSLRNSIPYFRRSEPLSVMIGSVKDQDKPLSRPRFELLRYIAKHWNVGIALGLSPSYVGTETEFFRAFSKGYRFQGLKFKVPAMFITGEIERKYQIAGILEDAPLRAATNGHITVLQKNADHFSQVLDKNTAQNTWMLIDSFLKNYGPQLNGAHFEVSDQFKGGYSEVGLPSLICERAFGAL